MRYKRRMGAERIFGTVFSVKIMVNGEMEGGRR
jgi:hypothetical protein